MNLDITVEEEFALPVRKTKAPTRCPHPFCGEKGHKTTRSKACKANPQRLIREGKTAECAATVAAAATAATAAVGNEQVGLEAADLNQHEAVPLVDNDDDSSIDVFQEAQTWSEDEDGNVI